MAQFKAMRLRAKIKLNDAAEHFGVTRQAVSSWERGDSAPKQDKLLDMANYYGCTVEELLSE